MKTPDVVALLANAAGVGMVCALVSFLAVRPNAGGDKTKVGEAIYGAANLLFLCVGLTGTMILVNNNVVRAFAVGAAIALVRFRVKLDDKSANASLLFAILAGIACGLGELVLAWTLLAAYVALSAFLAVVLRVVAGPVRSPEVSDPVV